MMLLIKNELMKLFSKKASIIYLVAILLAAIITGIIYKNVGPEPNTNWREDIETEIQRMEKDMANVPEEEKVWMQDMINQQQMYLDENVNPNATSNWHFMNVVVTGITVLVTLFAVIVASANVAAEFSDGTIKQLVIRPHKRWKILLSKYISVNIYSVILLVTLIVSGYLVGIVLFGNGDFNAKVVEYTLEGQALAVVGEQFVEKMLYFLPSLLMITTISFMLSTLFKSQALAVGIGIFVLFVSSTMGGLILMLAEEYTWAKYLIFPHLDLTVYALQDKILENITLPISLFILGVYYIVFMFLTFVFFQKRDISI